MNQSNKQLRTMYPWNVVIRDHKVTYAALIYLSRYTHKLPKDYQNVNFYNRTVISCYTKYEAYKHRKALMRLNVDCYIHNTATDK